ncbi:MAG: trimethylamine methyltransferase family protein [Anaerolineales bacterium]
MDNGLQQAPQFRVLSDLQIGRIFQATLDCLQRTGIKVQNPTARTILEKAGADVRGEIVHIPAYIIEEAVSTCPSSFTLWGRDGENPIELIDGQNIYGPGPSCTYFIEPVSGERRKTRLGDPGLTARVCDALVNIGYVMSLGLIDDVKPELASVYEFAEMVANTTKPVLVWSFSLDQLQDIYQIATAVVGSEENLRQKPFVGFFSTTLSPLTHTDKDLENMLWAAEQGLPVFYLGGGTVGSTAPITGAGALVITLAELLSGLAILQLNTPGTPVCIGSVMAASDLRLVRPAYGGPEMSLNCAAMSDISRYLGIPYMGTAGASESKTLDLQAAIESSFQVLLSSLSNATLVHDVGFLDCADIGSLEMLVMNDEIISMSRRIQRGIEVSDQTLMLDLIDEIGPGGEFLSSMETAQHCRFEIWMPGLMDRAPWIDWYNAGAITMHDRIKAKLQNILNTHHPTPLSEQITEKIAAILQAANQRYEKPIEIIDHWAEEHSNG